MRDALVIISAMFSYCIDAVAHRMRRRRLLKAVKNHEEWVNGNKGKKADFRGLDLCNIDLQGFDLRWADFSEADLSCAKLINCNLQKAVFRGCRMKFVDLFCSDLTKANLEGADMFMADIEGCTLRDTYFGGVDLSRVNSGGLIRIYPMKHSLEATVIFEKEGPRVHLESPAPLTMDCLEDLASDNSPGFAELLGQINQVLSNHHADLQTDLHKLEQA